MDATLRATKVMVDSPKPHRLIDTRLLGMRRSTRATQSQGALNVHEVVMGPSWMVVLTLAMDPVVKSLNRHWTHLLPEL